MENPKKAEGLKKVPYSYVPEGVIAGLALAMYEGKKYGRHNYRVVGNITSSTYTDACKRHLAGYIEGRDLDPFSQLHEISKAMASLAVLYDAIQTGNVDDDRPPKKLHSSWIENYNIEVERMNKDTRVVEPYTEKNYRERLGTNLVKIVDGPYVSLTGPVPTDGIRSGD